jgi:aspartyl-tRNA(Asn)/glutamyl-tRNA(Gln) amidotransferase subunit C
MEIKDVENLAELARLEIPNKDKAKVLADLGNILEYVRQIGEVKAKDKKRDFKFYNIWREDILEQCQFSREGILSQFPDSQDGFLKVKKIL